MMEASTLNLVLFAVSQILFMQALDSRLLLIIGTVAFGTLAVREVVRVKLPDNNPKSIAGVTKPALHLIPPAGLLHEALAFRYGAFLAGAKGTGYGPFNWRSTSVSASVYYSAMFRHLLCWWDGQSVAEDSLVHHLGHLRASAGIILDAIELGRLVDDRPPKGTASDLIAKLTVK